MTPTRCPSCGRDGCPSAADPVTGAMRRHNAAAYAELLRRRTEEVDCAAIGALVDIFYSHGLNGSSALREMAAQCLDHLGAVGWKHVPGYSTLGPDTVPGAEA